MTQEEARRHCKERGISQTLTQAERQALSKADFRMYVVAYSTGETSEVVNQTWATAAKARTAETITHRDQDQRLRDATGL